MQNNKLFILLCPDKTTAAMNYADRSADLEPCHIDIAYASELQMFAASSVALSAIRVSRNDFIKVLWLGKSIPSAPRTLQLFLIAHGKHVFLDLTICKDKKYFLVRCIQLLFPNIHNFGFDSFPNNKKLTLLVSCPLVKNLN